MIQFYFLLTLVTLSLLTAPTTGSSKYDLTRLPYDLRPVHFMVGKWKLIGTTGSANFVTPPNTLDFGINPIPMFGARVLNITGQYFHPSDPSQVEHTMYGFMPVRNATRRDPQIHTALITTYSQGINMIEQGKVQHGSVIKYHLKQFMRRSFGLGSFDFVLNKLDREFRVDGNSLQMMITSETNRGGDSYTAGYWRIQL